MKKPAYNNILIKVKIPKIQILMQYSFFQNRGGGGDGPNRRRVEPQTGGRTGNGNEGGSGLFFEYYGDVYDDMEVSQLTSTESHLVTVY